MQIFLLGTSLLVLFFGQPLLKIGGNEGGKNAKFCAWKASLRSN
jgi:hypothetical protein